MGSRPQTRGTPVVSLTDIDGILIIGLLGNMVTSSVINKNELLSYYFFYPPTNSTYVKSKAKLLPTAILIDE